MRLVPALPAVVIAFGLVGCNSVTVAQAKVQEEIKHTSALTKTGRVQLHNVNGKVRITGWGRSEVQVVAVKRADRQADLDAVKIEIDAKPDHIRIHTKYPNSKSGLWKRSNSTSVDYEIKVPTEAQLDSVETVNGSLELDGVYGSVHASTVNGKLTAQGLGGDAKLESVNGAVEVTFDKLAGVKSVSLNAVNGKISLTLPQNADADVSAKTINGSIQTAPDLAVTKQWPVGRQLKGKLGKGGAQIRAETVNGGIRIAQTQSTAKTDQTEGKLQLEEQK